MTDLSELVAWLRGVISGDLESARKAAEYDTKMAAAREQLDRITDPIARKILDLHHEDERGECLGDDFDGYDAEPPTWPCRTVRIIARHFDIDIPE